MLVTYNTYMKAVEFHSVHVTNIDGRIKAGSVFLYIKREGEYNTNCNAILFYTVRAEYNDNCLRS